MEIDYDKLYYFVDNFCLSFEPWYRAQVFSGEKKRRHRLGQLRLSEVVTIVLAYHQSGRSCFKYFYQHLFCQGRHLFPKLVDYTRFLVLIKRAFPVLLSLLHALRGEVTEYLFIDSTPISVCHNRRERCHRVFADAAKGRTSIGFFFGFKLHLVCNTKGEIVRLTITPGNTDDRTPVRDMMQEITAKLIGDKGYISQSLLADLFKQGTTLITKIRKNMHNRLLPLKDKIMLQKRFFIETIFSSLKTLGTFVHHRHRSPINAFSHLIAALINYQLRTDKPSIHHHLNDLP